MNTKHPLYQTWTSMRTRCNNPKSWGYKWYGARGITVCSRWDDFTAFVTDMGERPAGTTLDRKDNNGNYEPSNCQWSTKQVQISNREYRNDKYPSLARNRSPRTHCIRGHEFDKANTRISTDGKRYCRKCVASRAKQYRLNKKGLNV